MAGSSKKQVLSRRSLFGVAGGAAGLLIAKKVVNPAIPAIVTPNAPVLGEILNPGPGATPAPVGSMAQGQQIAAQAGTSAQAASNFAAPTVALACAQEDKRLTPGADVVVPGPEADKRREPAAEVFAQPSNEVIVQKHLAENVVPPEQVVRLPTPEDDKRRAGSPNEAEGPAPRTFVAASTPVLELLAPLKPGAQVYDWTVVAIHDVSMGAVPVILADKSGAKFQVDILRRDHKKGAPQSVADAHGLSLFLANNGNGKKTSDETKGLGVVALATVLSRHSKKGAPAGLLTWRERVSLFPKGEYKAPV